MVTARNARIKSTLLQRDYNSQKLEVCQLCRSHSQITLLQKDYNSQKLEVCQLCRSLTAQMTLLQRDYNSQKLEVCQLCRSLGAQMMILLSTKRCRFKKSIVDYFCKFLLFPSSHRLKCCFIHLHASCIYPATYNNIEDAIKKTIAEYHFKETPCTDHVHKYINRKCRYLKVVKQPNSLLRAE